MDITDNKYIKFIFEELAKVPGRRYSSMLYKKLNNDQVMPQQEKGRIEIAIALLKMSGYVEEKSGSTPVMNLVLATEDKGNKVINYGKHVDIAINLLDWMPFEENRQNHGMLLYELTGDNDSFFPATDESVKTAISKSEINLPSEIIDRIDIYEYVMCQTERSAYEMFLKTLSENIEKQKTRFSENPVIDTDSIPSVATFHITNPVIIGNMSDNKVKAINKSTTTNVVVNGNENQVVTNSKNTKLDNNRSGKSPQHWLQILYWLVGIVVAFFTIYSFLIK